VTASRENGRDRAKAKCIVSIFSDRGKRKNNEDYAAHWFDRKSNSTLLILADGMGGHASGEVASRMAVEAALRLFTERPSAQASETIQSAFDAAHATICAAASSDPARQGMGTTMTIAYVSSDKLVIGHVGDSRAFQFRGTSVRRLTADDLEVIEALEIPEPLAKRHPHGNILSQALGVGDRVKPTISAFDVVPKDVIMLCSDGVTDVLNEPDILATLNGGKPETAAERLTKQAIHDNSKDNCTAIVLWTR
jgi:protein phosphatase